MRIEIFIEGGKETNKGLGCLYTVAWFQLLTLGDLVGQLYFQQGDEPPKQFFFCLKYNGKAVLVGVEGDDKLVLLAISPPIDVETGFNDYGPTMTG